MEKIYYLFVDLEWEQKNDQPSENDVILEIGAIKTDSKKFFMRYIKPKASIRKKTLRLLKITPQDICNGESENVAVKELVDYSKGTTVTVVWSVGTKEKLIQLADKYNYPSIAKKIVVLQELIGQLSNTDNMISFERALIKTNAKYVPSRMHNAGIDSKCLCSLFYRVCSKYEKDNSDLMQTGIIKLQSSNTYHAIDCHYIKDKISDDCKCRLSDAITLLPCKKCMRSLKSLDMNVLSLDKKKVNFILKYKGRAAGDNDIRKIAEAFGLSIYRGSEYITVVTGYSSWKVYYRNGFAYKLKHENYKGRDNISQMNHETGFHEHENFPTDIYSLFDYISGHDSSGRIRPISEDMERKKKHKDKLKKMHKSRKYIEQDDWEEYQDEIYTLQSNMKLRKRM